MSQIDGWGAMPPTAKQLEAQRIIAGDATHILLEGGSRSGKTVVHTRNTVLRAIKAPGSRHAIFRFRFNHLTASIVADTLPKVLKHCFPGVKWKLDKRDWFAELGEEAQIWFSGLDEKERTEKVLGQEYATIYLNEISQIPRESRDIAITRLAQRVRTKQGPLLKLRAFYDCNPPSKAHWAYKLFVLRQDLDTNQPLPRPEDYARFRMNPRDNEQNLGEGYLAQLAALPAAKRRRFLDGDWSDATPNQLFHEEHIDRWRVIDGKVPDLVRVVVAVDPSGADDQDNTDNDEIGIAAAGLGVDGNAYLLEDNTVKAGPATWGNVAVTTYDRLKGDCIVGEDNFGGAMVKYVIQTVKRPGGGLKVPYRAVHASRGKVQRAEPVAALYEQGKVRHVGYFPQLEDELGAFSTTGYTGAKSPNRADAAIWAITALFPGLTKQDEEAERPERDHRSRSWMGA